MQTIFKIHAELKNNLYFNQYGFWTAIIYFMEKNVLETNKPYLNFNYRRSLSFTGKPYACSIQNKYLRPLM